MPRCSAASRAAALAAAGGGQQGGGGIWRRRRWRLGGGGGGGFGGGGGGGSSSACPMIDRQRLQKSRRQPRRRPSRFAAPNRTLLPKANREKRCRDCHRCLTKARRLLERLLQQPAGRPGRGPRDGAPADGQQATRPGDCHDPRRAARTANRSRGCTSRSASPWSSTAGRRPRSSGP